MKSLRWALTTSTRQERSGRGPTSGGIIGTTDGQVDADMALGADAFVFKPVTIEELEGR